MERMESESLAKWAKIQNHVIARKDRRKNGRSVGHWDHNVEEMQIWSFVLRRRKEGEEEEEEERWIVNNV